MLRLETIVLKPYAFDNFTQTFFLGIIIILLHIHDCFIHQIINKMSITERIFLVFCFFSLFYTNSYGLSHDSCLIIWACESYLDLKDSRRF